MAIDRIEHLPSRTTARHAVRARSGVGRARPDIEITNGTVRTTSLATSRTRISPSITMRALRTLQPCGYASARALSAHPHTAKSSPRATTSHMEREMHLRSKDFSMSTEAVSGVQHHLRSKWHADAVREANGHGAAAREGTPGSATL